MHTARAVELDHRVDINEILGKDALFCGVVADCDVDVAVASRAALRRNANVANTGDAGGVGAAAVGVVVHDVTFLVSKAPLALLLITSIALVLSLSTDNEKKVCPKDRDTPRAVRIVRHWLSFKVP